MSFPIASIDIRSMCPSKQFRSQRKFPISLLPLSVLTIIICSSWNFNNPKKRIFSPSFLFYHFHLNALRKRSNWELQFPNQQQRKKREKLTGNFSLYCAHLCYFDGCKNNNIRIEHNCKHSKLFWIESFFTWRALNSSFRNAKENRRREK